MGFPLLCLLVGLVVLYPPVRRIIVKRPFQLIFLFLNQYLPPPKIK